MEKKGFKTLGKQLINEDLAKNDDLIDREVLDEFTSGFYIIDSIEYIYDPQVEGGSENTFYQKIKLLRREWPTKIKDLDEETLEADAAPAPAPEPTPAPPPPPAAVEPTLEPTPEPTPLKEPVFTLDVNSIKNREGIGSWWDLTETVLWKADDKSLVTETPKIKIVFSGPSDYEIEATVSMEEKEKGDKPWNKVKYNAEFTIPKNTFKDKEGKYVVDVILTYKTQNVKETTKFEYRPWKADQLGGGYRISSWAEKTAFEAAAAIIAVSDGMRADVLAAYPAVNPAKVVTIRNGVDTQKFAPNHDATVPESFGISGPYAIFVGRITRQKGLAHLLRAWKDVPAEYGLVLAAGSPDEEGIGNEVAALIADLQRTRSNVWWIKEMLPHEQLTAMLTAADLFICPSIYEPLGIVNLEAMACSIPVVATATGGIPEVVVHGETGLLVAIEQLEDGSGTPLDESKFVSDFADALNQMLANPKIEDFGRAGRQRVERHFSWANIATETLSVYRKAITDFK